MAMTAQKKARQGRLPEIILLAGAVAGLGIWGWSTARESVYEDWHNWVFDREARREPATVSDYLKRKLSGEPGTASAEAIAPVPAPDVAPGADGLVGRLSIPRLQVRAIVREGTGDKTLSLALGHIAGTALPGQNGNVGVAGHRDALFRGLRNVRENDRIVFETPGGVTFEYLVKSTEIVKPDAVRVLNAGLYPELTLVTCYPFTYVGSAPDRFIVKARQISQTSGRQPEPLIAEVPVPKAVAKPPQALQPATPVRRMDGQRIPFEIAQNHSRELGRGISIGLTKADQDSKRVDGWLWLMPDKRTVWLRHVGLHEPFTFHASDGRKRELVIDSVTHNSMRGYMVVRDGAASARSAGGL